MKSLKYNVLLPNVNNEKGFTFNIFRSNRFLNCLMDLKARCKKDNTIDIKEEVRRSLRYSFWAKVEYEIMAHAIFGTEDYKIDVYEQVMLNFDLFFEYLMNNWKKIPAKTYRQQLKEMK